MSKNAEKSTKPAGADYPVDPVERSNQEARLKKAAAAGASASKSPIPGLMLQARPTATQPAIEPQTSSPKTVAATNAVPQIAEVPSESRISNEEVLVELRKISAWADQQRKITKWSLIFVVGLVPVLVGAFIIMDRHLETDLQSNPPSRQSDWYDVDRNVRAGDFEKAATIGEELIAKTPQSPDAHERLARTYLAAGNIEKAKLHYAEAFRLFPSEQNEKLLNAIEKRIQAEKP